MNEKQKKTYSEFLQAGGRDGFLREVAKAKFIREKVSKIPQAIEMPVYYYEDENDRAIIKKDGTLVYDFEEMAIDLESSISKILGKNVLITISEPDQKEL